VLAILLVMNPVATAVIGFQRYEDYALAIASLSIYSVVGLTSALYYRELKMPIALALLNLLVAVGLPVLVYLSVGSDQSGSHATWYVTGVATLMAISAVRKQTIIAWTGSLLLAIEVLALGGVDQLFNSGLAGALGLVVAGHAISFGLVRATLETNAYLELAKTTEAASAADSATRAFRSTRLAKTMQGALQVLGTIASGAVDEATRLKAKTLEAELRDEIRGRNLINPKLKDSVSVARNRGVEVVLLDEGGLDQSSEIERETYRNILADELDLIREGRVTIRAPYQEKVRVTFVATRPGTAKPDVWLRL
jgi:hypothetical protein